MRDKKPGKKNKRLKCKKIIFLLLLAALVLALAGCSALSAAGEDPENDGPFGGVLGNREDSMSILVLLTILSVLPSILLMLTAFTRIIIVLSLLRNGLGLQQMPPNQVLIGLALFLTLFVMSPVVAEVKETAYTPYIENQMTEEEALETAMKPVRGFMFKQTYKKDLEFFLAASGNPEAVATLDEIPNTVLIPAFMTSEIQRGFQIGFFIYIPFIVIDMVVASALMSMGMMMLPPVIISLPFKLLLFVLVDGWTLTVQTLLTSFG